MKTQTLNVGLIGFGMAGRTFHAPLIQTAPGLELTAVVSSDAERVQAVYPEVAVHAKSASLFADPDIDLVVIATPNETHFPLAKAALAKGKHVVLDKPFAVSLAEARQLKSLADGAERLLSVFHNRRWDSDLLTLKGLLDEQRLGRVVEVESRFDRFRPTVPDRWREQHRPGSGIWFDLGPHLLDQARSLFGMPRAILLELASLRDGAEIDDDFQAVLEYDRLRVTLKASALVAEPTPRWRVNGTRGSFVKYGLDPQEDWLKAGEIPQPAWGVDPSPGRLTLNEGEGDAVELVHHEVEAVPGDYRAYYDAIARTLLRGTPPPVSVDEALDVMSLLEAGLDSYRQGRWVKLKEGGSLPRRLHAKG
ncbi:MULTISPECIES: oxidoreductase [Halomonas]|uniref:Oxidoreductase n=1 Tax=Halomonas halophila TaxID=29573 RepID=A0ABQ0U4K3_9GAMM|nr:MULTISPECIES: oxidoreductase [Halomonas]MDR5888885.1 oxidoreductase [Halomonas salina]RAH38594.1 oxidoreductase [Halomonas sp. SL1]WJY08062.1 oxidoreductase [Halomonas halophila]GEK73320.1 oxidoreductase [Halomonas halophila]